MGPPPTSHFHVLADSPSGLQSINPIRVNQPCAAKVLDIKPKTESDCGMLSFIFYSKSPLYKDDWNKVCEHVGSRTQDECILHFLRLPIEDPYLEDAGEADPVMGPLQHQPIPFSRAGNPIMSTVAFLASVVDPRIAAAAASAAMTEFCRIKEEVPAALLDSHVRTVASNVAAGNAPDGNLGLDKTGIAGTTTDDEDKEKDAVSKDGAVATTPEKSEEKMQVDGEEKDSAEASKGAEEEKKTAESEDTEKKDEVSGDVSKDATKSEANKSGEDGKVKSEEKDSDKKETSTKDPSEEEDKRQAVEKLRKDASVQQAAAAALGAAAVKAKHLAAVEERKIKSLVALLVETQMKKLEIKLRHFEELETIMDRERESLELQRQQLLQEQQQFHLEQLKAAELRARQHALHQLHQQQQQQHSNPSTPGAAAAAAPAATAVSH
ncbi:hypothetical protein HAZT_HAZT008995 [Hyalella azteca]|uniref:SANT domain-containing protein n=1 Tax=Hyalella azteca TaxID=294128 RepID=A0A6A0H328_HYAAZ|nr:hypothetical protein HAZT_HAZT008995 [Hyalella azteca]